MQKCQDNYYATFSSYLTLLDYHEEQAKDSQWIRCKVNTLQIEPLGKTSPLTGIALLQGEVSRCNAEIKKYEKEIAAHSVRIAEVMKEHEHGVLETTKDKLLIDFVTKTTRRPDSKALKDKYPTVYTDVLKASESRKVKVSVQPI